MTTKTLGILALVIVVLLGGYLLLSRSKTSTSSTYDQNTPSVTSQPSAMTKEGVSVVLGEQNASGESGIATLAEKDGKVVVTIKLTGAPTDIEQPAHIHLGACPTPGDVKYPLTNVVNGESETTLDVGMDELNSSLPLAVNVHMSNADIKTYVACGDIAAK